MTKTRQKKIVITGITQRQMEEAFNNYALLSARIQSLTAGRDEALIQIKETFQEEVTPLLKEQKEQFEILQAFAMENREKLFSKKKSMDTVFGTLGFRTGTPILKTKKGSTWAAVLELLKTYRPAYIRVKEEVNKDRLKEDCDKEEVLELMDKVGVYVDQEEAFFVKLADSDV